MKRNPFLARTQGVYRGRSASLGELDGFHTASTQELVVPYANMKGSPFEAPEFRSFGNGVWDDIPVILHFDMTGLPRVPDIDAERALDLATDYLRNLDLNDPTTLKKQLVHDEGIDVDPDIAEVGGQTNNALWEMSGSPSTASGAWRSLRYWLEALTDSEIERFLATLGPNHKQRIQEDFGPEILAEIFQQQKYLENIEQERLIAVEYLAPYYEKIIAEDNTYYEEGEEYIADPDAWVNTIIERGFMIVTDEDVIRSNLPMRSKGVWKSRRKKREDARVEYHGTSYQNLLRAVPGLRLPKPPKPFGLTLEQIDDLDPSNWTKSDSESDNED